MAKLYFARYTLVSAKSVLKKFDLLLDGLRDDASLNQRGFTYRFLDTEVFEFDGKEFIAGHLVKYDPDDQEEVVNETTRKLHFEFVPNKVVGKARFIIDPDWSLLMFCEVPRAISSYMFADIFSKLFEQNHDNIFTSFNISPIKERYSFIERVRRYRAIRRILITLFPSNPNFDERWQKIDERLRNNNIEKYKEIQENNSPNGRIIVDDETESKFLMAEDGYGQSRVSGTDENGNQKTISTNDNEKNVFESVPSETDSPATLLELVYTTLMEIIERTSK